jgi:aryl-alcohol dehydrogenase-like predicted oxidoreductase
MGQLVREGKITYVGSSNFAGWDIATAQCTAASRNLLGLASEQSLYNLTERTIELEVIPALRHFGVGATILAVNTLSPCMLTALIERPDRLVYLSSSTHLQHEEERSVGIESVRDRRVPSLDPVAGGGFIGRCRHARSPPRVRRRAR